MQRPTAVRSRQGRLKMGRLCMLMRTRIHVRQLTKYVVCVSHMRKEAFNGSLAAMSVSKADDVSTAASHTTDRWCSIV